MKLHVAASEHYTYSNTLGLYVYRPKIQKPHCAVVILIHGGKWDEGDASWVTFEAKRFAEMGLVAVTIDYRLASGNITPLESVQDVKRAIRWVRDHSIKLGIDPSRVAVYGVSAGGHLALESFLWPSLPRPNAILLMSPNVSVAHSRWFRHLTWKRLDPLKLSPIDNLRSMPPVCIMHGTLDTRANYSEVARFQEISTSLGNICELHTFKDYGHMLVAPGKDDHISTPDKAAENRAFGLFTDFLRRIFFL
jgi:acetyl esterase/lipase